MSLVLLAMVTEGSYTIRSQDCRGVAMASNPTQPGHCVS